SKITTCNHTLSCQTHLGHFVAPSQCSSVAISVAGPASLRPIPRTSTPSTLATWQKWTAWHGLIEGDTPAGIFEIESLHVARLHATSAPCIACNPCNVQRLSHELVYPTLRDGTLKRLFQNHADYEAWFGSG